MTGTNRTDVDAPSRTDAVVAVLSQTIGGPHGRHAVDPPRRRFWIPPRVILAAAIVMFTAACLQKLPCAEGGWVEYQQYTQLCYTDIRALWTEERLSEGAIPYFDHAVEYPVVTGVFMGLLGLLSYAMLGADGGPVFYHLNALFLCAAGLAAVAGLWRARERRPWDAMMLAAAPVVLFTATVNWDLLAVALTVFFLLAWARGQTILAGTLLGLAVAAKFYPLLVAGPLLVLALRHRRLAPALTTVGVASATWLAVNLPFMVWAFDGWKRFFTLNSERPLDWGTSWYVLRHFSGDGLAAVLNDSSTLNTLYLVAFVVCCTAIAGLALLAPTPPRLAQLAFLVVAAFLLTGKVWSQQYVLWLLPLLILARPTWRALLVWQACELFYFFSFYGKMLAVSEDVPNLPAWSLVVPEWVFVTASTVRVAAVVGLCVLVVRDVLDPGRDVVRRVYDGDPDAGALLPASALR
ncbi:MAG: glycosyltransferase family 87 protein [Stackebrandtia sp.]